MAAYDDIDTEIASNSILKIDNRDKGWIPADQQPQRLSMTAVTNTLPEKPIPVRETISREREREREKEYIYDRYSPVIPTPQEFTPSQSLSFYSTDIKLLKRPGTSLDCCIAPRSPQSTRHQTQRPYSAQGKRTNRHEWSGWGERTAQRAESRQSKKAHPQRPKTATPTPSGRRLRVTNNLSIGYKHETRSKKRYVPVPSPTKLAGNGGLPMTDPKVSKLIYENLCKGIVEERESYESTSCCYSTVLEHVRVLTDGDDLPSHLLTSTGCLLLSNMCKLFSRFEGIYSRLLSVIFQSIFVNYTEDTKPETFITLTTYSEVAKRLQQERDETEAKSERAQMANKAVSGIILTCSKRWQELSVGMIFKTWKRYTVEQKHQILTVTDCLQRGKRRRTIQHAFSEWKTATILQKNRMYVQDTSKNTTVLSQWLEDARKQVSAKEREIQKLRGAKVLNKRKTDALTEMLEAERKENSRLRTKLRDAEAKLTNMMDIVSSTFCELRRRHVNVLAGKDSEFNDLEKVKEAASVTTSCNNSFSSPAQCGDLACESPESFLKRWASSVSGRPMEDSLTLSTLKQVLYEMSKNTATPLPQIETAQETILALRQFGVCGSYTASDVQRLAGDNCSLLYLIGALFQRNISGDLSEGNIDRPPTRLPRDRLDIGEVIQLRDSLLSDIERYRTMKQIGWAVHSYCYTLRCDSSVDVLRTTSYGYSNSEVFSIPSTMFETITMLIDSKLRGQVTDDLRSGVITNHLRGSHTHTYRVYLWYRLLEKGFNSQVWVFLCDTLQVQEERAPEVYFEILGKELLMSYRKFLSSLVVIANYESGPTFSSRWFQLISRLGTCPYLNFDQVLFALSDKAALKIATESQFTKKLSSMTLTEEVVFSTFDSLKLPISRAAVCVLLSLILRPNISPSSQADLPGQHLIAKHIPQLVVAVSMLAIPAPCLTLSQKVQKFLTDFAKTPI